MCLQGDLIEGRTVRRAQAEVTKLAWCPTKSLLAISWDDGTISIWNESTGTGQTNDDSDVHSGRVVTVLHWSPDGTRLVSGDEVSSPRRPRSATPRPGTRV